MPKIGFRSISCERIDGLGSYFAYILLLTIPRLGLQGGHALWKTGKRGKMLKKYSLQGKIREFEILLKIRGKSGNFKKSYLCKVKIFKFYSCSDVATGGFFLPHA